MAYFLAFRAVSSREKLLSSSLVSDISIRFSSRVGQVVGQKASGSEFILRINSGKFPFGKLLRLKGELDLGSKLKDGVNKDRQSGTQPVLFAKCQGVEFEDELQKIIAIASAPWKNRTTFPNIQLSYRTILSI